jgi:hypothetical protein
MAKEKEFTVTNVNLLHSHTYLNFRFTKKLLLFVTKNISAGAQLLAPFDASVKKFG